MYITYASQPGDPGFANDFLQALENKQILLHIIPNEEWKFYLGAYTLSDWTAYKDDIKDHSEWYEWNERELGLDGSWEAVLKLKDSPTTDFQKLVSGLVFDSKDPVDVRIQPMGRIVFGILVFNSNEDIDLTKTLRNNLGSEHKSVVNWDSLNPNKREAISRKIAKNYTKTIDLIDRLPGKKYVLRLNDGRMDWVGGHANILELINVTQSMGSKLVWEKVIKEVNDVAFRREMEEELGIKYVSGDTYETAITKQKLIVKINHNNKELPAIIHISKPKVSRY